MGDSVVVFNPTGHIDSSWTQPKIDQHFQGQVEALRKATNNYKDLGFTPTNVDFRLQDGKKIIVLSDGSTSRSFEAKDSIAHIHDEAMKIVQGGSGTSPSSVKDPSWFNRGMGVLLGNDDDAQPAPSSRSSGSRRGRANTSPDPSTPTSSAHGTNDAHRASHRRSMGERHSATTHPRDPDLARTLQSIDARLGRLERNQHDPRRPRADSRDPNLRASHTPSQDVLVRHLKSEKLRLEVENRHLQDQLRNPPAPRPDPRSAHPARPNVPDKDAELRDGLDQVLEDRRNLTQQVQDLSTRLRTAEQRLHEIEEQRQQAIAENANLKHAQAQHQTQVQTLQDKIQDLQNQLANAQSVSDADQAKIADLECQLTIARREHADARDEIAKINDEKNQVNEILAELNIQHREQLDKIRKDRDKLSDLSLDELKKNVELEKELDRVKNEVHELKAQLNSADANASKRISDQIDRHRVYVANLRATIDSLQKELKDAQAEDKAEAAAQEARISHLEEQLSLHQKTVDEAKSRATKLEHQLKQLESQLEDSKKESATAQQLQREMEETQTKLRAAEQAIETATNRIRQIEKRSETEIEQARRQAQLDIKKFRDVQRKWNETQVQQRTEELRTQLSNTEVALEDSKRSKKSNERAIQEQKARIEKLTKQTEQLQLQLSEQEDILHSELEKRIQSAHERHKRELDNLQEELNSSQARFLDAESRYNQLFKILQNHFGEDLTEENLDKYLSNLRKNINEIGEQIQSLESENSELYKRIAELENMKSEVEQDQITELTEQLESARAEAQSKVSEIKKLREQLSKAEQATFDLTSQISQVREDAQADVQEKISALETQLSSTEIDRSSAKSRAADLERQLKQLESQLEDSKKESATMQQLQEEMLETQTKLRDAVQTVETATNRIRQIEERSETEIAQAQNQAQLDIEKYKDAQRQWNERQVQQRTEELQTQLSETEVALSTAQRSKQTNERAIQEQKAKIEELTRKTKHLQEQLTEQAELSHRRGEQRVQREQQQHQKEMEDLQSQISNLTKENEKLEAEVQNIADDRDSYINLLEQMKDDSDLLERFLISQRQAAEESEYSSDIDASPDDLDDSTFSNISTGSDLDSESED